MAEQILISDRRHVVGGRLYTITATAFPGKFVRIRGQVNCDTKVDDDHWDGRCTQGELDGAADSALRDLILADTQERIAAH